MSSDTSTRYGSRVRRQGGARPWRRNHARSLRLNAAFSRASTHIRGMATQLTPPIPGSPPAAGWPISFDDVLAARERLSPFLAPTPLRQYPQLDSIVGSGIALFVKHENHQLTSS